jgi:hypothetical protein
VKKLSDPRFLAVYSGAVTAVLMALLFSGFTPARKKAVFDEIEVKRINLVEPDGTLRMVVSDKAMFPGLIKRGKEYPHDRGCGGMIFYNDEGTENGGLVFAGSKDAEGKVRQSGGSLTFDQYEQDQAIQMEHFEDGAQRMAALKINDLPGASLDLENEQRLAGMKDGPGKEELKAIVKRTHGIKNRVFLGKNEDSSAELVMKDQQGRKRVVIKVAPDGAPSLELLDENGKVTASLPQEAK